LIRPNHFFNVRSSILPTFLREGIGNSTDTDSPPKNPSNRDGRTESITPIAKPKKRKKGEVQQSIVFDKDSRLWISDTIPPRYIHAIRERIDRWRAFPEAK
jgi:hypothetical protein